MMTEKDEVKQIKVSSKEEQLLKMVRELGFGEMLIHVSDGQPVRAEEIKKSVKF